MAQYQTSVVSQVNVPGCSRSLLREIGRCQWIVQRNAGNRIICRERNVHGGWEEDIVTIEVLLHVMDSARTRIELNAYNHRPGEPAREYARHLVQSLLRRVDTDLRPQRAFAVS